ncbi:MAG: AAA family ATPase [Candidatus Altiarchaeia archaeon]
MDKELNNIWELYGLRENPFSTSPLLVKGGTLPIESFVGREEQVKRLLRIFGSRGGSRMLVCGDVGAGKTTFVNYARNHALQKGFFTPFKEIGVQGYWDTDQFILNTLAGIYATAKLMKEDQRPLDKGSYKKLEALLEIGSKDFEGGVSAAGFGINIGRQTRQPTQISTITLESLFQEITAEIVEKTGKDMILHYNNLELLPESSITTIFNNLRDLMQTPNIHFVFVGNLTVKSIFQNMPRVSSIMSDTPIIIDSLKKEEIEEIIKKRMEKIRIGKDLNYVVPYNPDVLKTLYDLYGGNIRDILNSLSTAITEVAKEKPVILDQALLERTLKSVVEKRYLTGLQKRARQVLLEAVKHKEITNRELSDRTKIARTNISTYLKQLESSGCMYLRRKEGKDKYWATDPRIKWLMLSEGKSLYKPLTEY